RRDVDGLTDQVVAAGEGFTVVHTHPNGQRERPRRVHAREGLEETRRHRQAPDRRTDPDHQTIADLLDQPSVVTALEVRIDERALLIEHPQRLDVTDRVVVLGEPDQVREQHRTGDDGMVLACHSRNRHFEETSTRPDTVRAVTLDSAPPGHAVSRLRSSFVETATPWGTVTWIRPDTVSAATSSGAIKPTSTRPLTQWARTGPLAAWTTIRPLVVVTSALPHAPISTRPLDVRTQHSSDVRPTSTRALL